MLGESIPEISKFDFERKYGEFWEKEDGDISVEEYEILNSIPITNILFREEERRERKIREYELTGRDDNLIFEHMKELIRTRNETLKSVGYVLKVWFANFRPKIFRDVVVPGEITLFDLNDRVLSPIFGFFRNYHGHYFKKLPYDKFQIYNKGIVYGPPADIFGGSQYVDLMHVNHYGMEMVDDRNVILCDVLKKEGEKMEYVYDLGDYFSFFIEVRKMIRDKKYDRHIYLMDGQGVNLPEDGDGNRGIAKYFSKLKKYKDDPERIQQLREKKNNCCNYLYNGMTYPTDPLDFDLKKCKVVLQINLRDDRCVIPTMTDVFPQFGKETGKPKTQNTPNRKTGIIMSSQNDYKEMKKMMKIRGCYVCKSKKKWKKLKKCSNCFIVFYCSRKCQIQDWKMHKLVCRKMKGRSEEDDHE